MPGDFENISFGRYIARICSLVFLHKKIQFSLKTTRIKLVHWIIQRVFEEIQIATGEKDWILRRPPSRLRVIVSRPKPFELRIPIVETAGEAKCLEPGVGVEGNVAESVVVHPL